MPVENAQFLNTLNPVYPAATDAVAQADDHIRLIKQVLKDTFPNINAAITATPIQLNNLFPVGGIIMWSGAVNAIPTGWALCDGSTVNRLDGSGTIVTPDMRDRFVVGWRAASGSGSTAVTAIAPGVTGGDHSKTIDTASGGAHSHTGTTSASGDHNHSGNTNATVLTVAQLPAHGHNNRHFSDMGSTQGGAGTYPAGLIYASSAYRGLRHVSYDVSNSNEIEPTGGNQGHTHGIAASGTHTHTLTIGEGGAHVHTLTVDVRPKYFTVAYLMKI